MNVRSNLLKRTNILITNYAQMEMWDLAMQDCEVCIANKPTYMKPWAKKIEILEKLQVRKSIPYTVIVILTLVQRWDAVIDAYDDACKASEEADEMFADVYERAKAELKKEAAVALHNKEASLEPTAEETTEKVG